MVAATAVDAKLEVLRAQLPAVLLGGYFNTGSNGPLPIVAFEAAQEAARRELERGRIAPGTYEANRDRNRELAALAAAMFGAEADEIALTHSASEGLNAALMGLAWQRGDEIVSTHEEHPGLLLPLALLGHRFGAMTRFVESRELSEDPVAAIAARLSPRTRVIALSHVLWSTGAVLPLREIAQIARERGVMVIVDGAQSAGQIPIDLHALGVDAYAIAGQKWLCGPDATGFLYVRRDRFADIAPTYARYGQFDASGYYLPAAGAKRYEIGEFYAPAIAAQEAALCWLRDDVGLDWGYDRIARLGASFAERLAEVAGVNVITPRESTAGLVNFTVSGLAPQEVVAEVFTRGYTIRYVATKPCTESVRASIGWWNTEDEVAGLSGALAELAARGSGRGG